MSCTCRNRALNRCFKGCAESRIRERTKKIREAKKLIDVLYGRNSSQMLGIVWNLGIFLAGNSRSHKMNNVGERSWSCQET